MLDLIGYHSACAGIAASLVGKSVISPTDPVIYVAHDYYSGACVTTYNMRTRQADARTFGAYSASGVSAFAAYPSSDGRLAVILRGTINKLIVFNSDTEEVLAEIDGSFSRVLGWRSIINDVLAVTDSSGYIKFYDGSTLTQITSYINTSTVVVDGDWSSDGAYFFFTGTSGKGWSVLNWSTKTLLSTSGVNNIPGGGVKAVPGASGSSFMALAWSNSSPYYLYNSSGTARSASTSITTGTTGRLAFSSSKFVAIFPSRSNSNLGASFRDYSWTSSSFSSSVISGAPSIIWTTVGKQCVASPKSGYFLFEASSATYSNQFNFYNVSTNAVEAGFSVNATVYDANFDPRGTY